MTAVFPCAKPVPSGTEESSNPPSSRMAPDHTLLTPVRTFLPLPIRFAVLAVLICATVVTDVRGTSLLAKGRQVPQHWYTKYGEWQSYFMYGAMLGSVLLTHVPYASAYVLILAPTMLSSFVPAICLGALMGGTRAFAVVLGAGAPSSSSRWLFRGRSARTVWSAVSIANSIAVFALVAR